jgi:DNA-binding transcriptional regulator YdaS (Cro superfamily)
MILLRSGPHEPCHPPDERGSFLAKSWCGHRQRSTSLASENFSAHTLLLKLPAMTMMSKSAFARYLGLSPARVSQYIKAGMPTYFDGTLNIERAERWIRKNVRTSRNGWMDRGRWQAEFRHCREEEAKLVLQYGDLDDADA